MVQELTCHEGSTAHIIRHVVVRTPVTRAADIERLWKRECAPLMIRQPGCIREELLRCLDDPEAFISVAEWADQQAIERYPASPAHEQIKRLAREVAGARATVKTYALVEG
jgi:heme-degrading monooxygenase HmoA